ncbi:hypothetical protein [Salibacterium sp. K-3]
MHKKEVPPACGTSFCLEEKQPDIWSVIVEKSPYYAEVPDLYSVILLSGEKMSVKITG